MRRYAFNTQVGIAHPPSLPRGTKTSKHRCFNASDSSVNAFPTRCRRGITDITTPIRHALTSRTLRGEGCWYVSVIVSQRPTDSSASHVKCCFYLPSNTNQNPMCGLCPGVYAESVRKPGLRVAGLLRTVTGMPEGKSTTRAAYAATTQPSIRFTCMLRGCGSCRATLLSCLSGTPHATYVLSDTSLHAGSRVWECRALLRQPLKTRSPPLVPSPIGAYTSVVTVRRASMLR